jgi:hypothetical protein
LIWSTGQLASRLSVDAPVPKSSSDSRTPVGQAGQHVVGDFVAEPFLDPERLGDVAGVADDAADAFGVADRAVRVGDRHHVGGVPEQQVEPLVGVSQVA